VGGGVACGAVGGVTAFGGGVALGGGPLGGTCIL